MLKIAAILLMLVVAHHGLFGQVGGYEDRPELTTDSFTQNLARFAAEAQNLLGSFKITRVQTQIVNGVNYKIDFATEGTDGPVTSCQVVINVRFDSEKTILQAQCQTQ